MLVQRNESQDIYVYNYLWYLYINVIAAEVELSGFVIRYPQKIVFKGFFVLF